MESRGESARVYVIDMDVLAELYTADAVSKSVYLGWVRALVRPLRIFSGIFLVFLSDVRKEIENNGQVIRLETLLRERFGSELSYVEITDGGGGGVDFLVRVSGVAANTAFVLRNNLPFYIRNNLPVHIRNPTDSAIVASVRDLVNRYKIAGKCFEIVVI